MNIVGIDLGTTFSGLAVLDEIGKPEIVPNADGDRITPSIVFVDPDEDARVDVGDEARKQMVMYPERVIVEVKQKMGKGDEVIKVGSRTFTPTQISSFILKKLIQDAERIKGEIDEVVVTVPAHFVQAARKATKDAGEMAGVGKVTLVDEPVAAALLYATTRSVHGHALIFDLGGGTFDVTIAKIDGTKVEVVEKSGDPNLGGKDFDRALAAIVNDQYKALCGQALYDDKPDYSLMNQAEEVKKTLSRREKYKGVFMGPAGPQNLEITREQFENSISDYIGRIELLIDLALSEAGMAENDLDHVLLVGGSTRIPCIKALLKKRFGRDPEECVNVDEAVALGAAIYAGLQVDFARLNPLQRKEMESVNIINTAPANYGTIAIGDSGNEFNSIIICRHEKIPCSKTKVYLTVAFGQVAVDASVTQCPYEDELEFVPRLAEGQMTGLPAGRPRGQKFSVTFSYDKEGMMRCSFKDIASGMAKEIEVDTGGGDHHYRPSVDSDCDPSDFMVD